MEQQRSREALVSVLKYLLENDMIEDDRAQKITKKIVDENTLDNLTKDEIDRYEQDVLDKFEVDCDGNCSNKIDIEDLENAYLREMEFGELYCQHCMYDAEQHGL